MRMLRTWSLIAGVFAALLPAMSHAALVGQSTATTGQLRYIGVGDSGGGVGTGRYALGDCTFAGGVTTCTLSGTYAETADSTRAPNQTGTFTIVQTYAGNAASPVIAHSITPGSDVLQLGPLGGASFTLTLSPATGGTIVSVYPAPVFADSAQFSAFLATGATCTGLAAAQACTIGQVGLVPGATITGRVSPFQFTIPQEIPPPDNYQGLWWNAPGESESGWGMNFAHQGSVIFVTWFTYDASGKAWWLTMTADRVGNDETYEGTFYQTIGPAFNAVPFTPSQVTATPVGTGRLQFSSTMSGTFTYTVNGVTQMKSIVPQAFGPVPTCRWASQPNLTKATNYTDIWWAVPAGSESGWGINFTHQGTAIFATWFTYDTAHNPLWYTFTAFPTTTANQFSGDIYRTSGPPFSAVPFDPTKVTRTKVGTATLNFVSGTGAMFSYTVNDGANQATQVKPLTRQIFRPPGTACEQ